MNIKRKLKKGIAFLLTGVMAVTAVGAVNITKTYAQLDVTKASKITGEWGSKKEGKYFSSYEDGKNALVVDPSYGFRFISTKNSEFTVLQGKATDTPEQVGESTADFKWFKTKNNEAGKIQVKWSNLKIYQLDENNNGSWIDVDLVRTITKIEKHGGADHLNYTDSDGVVHDSDCYVALGKKVTQLAFIGVEEVTVRNDFYLAGTNTKQKLVTNVTLTDIDRGQYIGIKASQVDGQYVSKNTMLSYAYDDGMNIYWADHNENLKASADSAVGFIFYDDGFDYKFGKYRTFMSDPTAVNDSVQYVGSGQNMVKIQTPPPTKSVSDRNETEVLHNQIEHIGEDWTYTVEQLIPDGIPSEFYYDNFIFEDQIEACMKINSVKVYAVDAEGETDNVTKWFDITTSGNKVVAKATADTLSKSKFYKNCIYRLQVNVQMNVPENISESEWAALLSKWKSHGHYKESSETFYIEEENRASTTVDSKVENTNDVSTKVLVPGKKVSDNDETEVLHNDVRSLADTWTYSIKQNISQNVKEGQHYDSLTFADDIEECLDILKVEVLDASGKDVTDRFNVSTADNKVRAELKEPEKASNYSTQYYEFKVQVKTHIPENATDEEKEALRNKWKEHGHYSETEEYIRYGNIARVSVNGVLVYTNDVTTDVHLSTDDTKEPKPGLAITKDVNRYEHQVGEIIHYTVKVWNTNKEADTAYFIIEDNTLPDTMKLDAASIKISGIDSENYILETKGNSWTIISKGDYALPYGNMITVTYDAEALKTSNGTLVDNTATAAALGIPIKKDSEQVYINSPKIDVEKTAPQRRYKVGDTVGYKVIITNRNPGTFMREIHLHDLVETQGLEIKEGSVAVIVGGKDVTSKLDITYSDDSKGFDIITPYNLKNGTIPCIDKTPYNTIQNWVDKVTVTYDATITDEAAIESELKNTFTVPATPNTNGDLIKDDPDIPSGGGEDDEKIGMKPPTVRISKESDKKEYNVNDIGTYTLTIHQTKEELVARNIVVADKFEQREGFELDTESITVTLNKKDITSDCKVTKTEEGGFHIDTGKNMNEDDEMVITYKVKFTLSGTYENTAIVGSDNTLSDEDSNTITVPQDPTPDPKLNIVKTSDKKEYEVGQIGKYTLTVTKTPNSIMAKNITIEDKFALDAGFVIDKESFVVKLNDTDITKDCVITPEETTFKIETKKDLGDDDVITVTYDVKFTAVGKYDNKAVATSDNTPPAEDTNEVEVKKSDINIYKNAEKKTYKVGDDINYTVSIALKQEGVCVQNIVIEDNLPEGTKLDKDSVKVKGTANFTSEIKGNHIKILIPELKYGDKVTVTYKAKVLAGTEGKKLVNKATVNGDAVNTGKAETTVQVEKAPKVPVSISSLAPKTGDMAVLFPYIIVILLAGAAALGITFKQRKLKK